MKHVVATADMKIGKKGDILMTHALGSCLGLMVYDPIEQIGGMLHAMLPLSTINPEKAKEKPFMFVDTGVPEMFRQMYNTGTKKSSLVIKVAGCSVPLGNSKSFTLGERNFAIIEQLILKNNMNIKAMEIGGPNNLTVFFDVSKGSIIIRNKGREYEL